MHRFANGPTMRSIRFPTRVNGRDGAGRRQPSDRCDGNRAYLAHRVLDTYDEIVQACCQAWNALDCTPNRIRSIASQSWATVISHLRWYNTQMQASQLPCSRRSVASSRRPIPAFSLRSSRNAVTNRGFEPVYGDEAAAVLVLHDPLGEHGRSPVRQPCCRRPLRRTPHAAQRKQPFQRGDQRSDDPLMANVRLWIDQLFGLAQHRCEPWSRAPTSAHSLGCQRLARAGRAARRAHQPGRGGRVRAARARGDRGQRRS